jgi:soluble lytic murein transglycosylase-like protein
LTPARSCRIRYPMGGGLAKLAVVALVVAGLPASGGPVVVFSDGRFMRVESVERVDAVAHLFLEGGGALAVPADRIANWEDLQRAQNAPDIAEGIPTEEDAEPDPGWRLAAGEYADVIALTAERHDVSPALLAAVVQAESAFDPLAVSPKGARGLLQLMPDTAERFGVENPFDAAQSVEGGARYLSWLLDRYDGRMDLALAGYNAGEGAVDLSGGIPPYKETHRYVQRVLAGAARMEDPAP